MESRKRLIAIVAVAGAMLGAAAFGWGGGWLSRPDSIAFENPHRPGSAAFVAFAEYRTEMQANPAFVARMDGAADSEEAMRRGAVLTQSGVRRLSDGMLVERLELMLRLMQVGDDAQCAALAQGAPIDGDVQAFAAIMFALLDRADADVAQRWYAFTRDATLAALEERPIPAIGDGYREQLGEVIVNGLTAEDLDILLAMSEQRLIGLSDGARCAVGRKVLALILAQSEPERSQYARLMAEP
ncbi:MAG: hypothetical protein JNN33_11175 [Rhodospirillaceae bacterium]|nr:hypothetical protein [Rhodospirillaceae bacterium]